MGNQNIFSHFFSSSSISVPRRHLISSPEKQRWQWTQTMHRRQWPRIALMTHALCHPNFLQRYLLKIAINWTIQTSRDLYENFCLLLSNFKYKTSLFQYHFILLVVCLLLYFYVLKNNRAIITKYCILFTYLALESESLSDARYLKRMHACNILRKFLAEKVKFQPESEHLIAPQVLPYTI